jgi:hypothetical protein
VKFKALRSTVMGIKVFDALNGDGMRPEGGMGVSTGVGHASGGGGSGAAASRNPRPGAVVERVRRGCGIFWLIP